MSSADVSNSNHDPGTSSAVTDPDPRMVSSDPAVVTDPDPSMVSSDPAVVTDPDPRMVSSDPAVVTDPDPSMVSSDPAVVTDPDPSIVSPASDPSTVLQIRRKERRKHTLDDDLSTFYKPSREKRKKTPVVKY